MVTVRLTFVLRPCGEGIFFGVSKRGQNLAINRCRLAKGGGETSIRRTGRRCAGLSRHPEAPAPASRRPASARTDSTSDRRSCSRHSTYKKGRHSATERASVPEQSWLGAVCGRQFGRRRIVLPPGPRDLRRKATHPIAPRHRACGPGPRAPSCGAGSFGA